MNNVFFALNKFFKKITRKPLSFVCRVLSALMALAAINLAWAGDSHNHDSHQQDSHEHNAYGLDEHVDAVNLNQAQINTTGIELAQAQAVVLHEYLTVYGSVTLNAEKIQRVVARFKGVVRSVNKKVGDTVRAGELLASIESDESLKTYSLNAALDGVVLEREINIGEQTEDKPAFVLADISSLWVELALFPADLSKIQLGQQVRIINPHTAQQIKAELTHIAPKANGLNQAVNARVVLENTQRQWRPGQFVQAEILMAERPAAIAVRNGALQEHEGKQVVFVQEAGAFKPRPVRIGRSDNEWTEIIEGLNLGETYVSKNSFLIKADLGKGGAEHD